MSAHAATRLDLAQSQTHLEAIDDVPVWSISCFYVRRGYRKKGVMSALISAESMRCVTFGARFLIVGWAATPFVAKGKGERGAPHANMRVHWSPWPSSTRPRDRPSA